MKILTAAQIREIDRLSTEKYGVPQVLLMENAGMRVVEVLEETFEDLGECTIGILCGKGNNGGDGFVVARQLIQKGIYPFLFLFGQEEEVRGEARINLDILKAIGFPPTVILRDSEWAEEKVELDDADIIVDALLGTGLTKPVTGLFRNVIESLENDFPNATVVSIDLPSGLPADSGQPVGPAVRADLTVTFTALKPCLVLPPNHEKAGDVVVSDIGNPPELLEGADLQTNLISAPESFPQAHHARPDDTNKGDYGKVLVIAGSKGKTGAAAMTGQAALRSGAGLVTVATAASALPIIAGSMPELMTEPLPETETGGIAGYSNPGHPDLLAGKTVLAIGPGLGLHPTTQDTVRKVFRETRLPTILDADGLNAFVGRVQELRGDDQRGVVITPHPGEMARLIGRSVESVVANRVETARDFAVNHNLYVILKSFRTVLATPDASVYINATGNPGMATGGTGDVLTGMIAGIIAQENLGSFVERLCLAIYLHGLAGDIAAEELGEETMVATDILRSLKDAWKQIRQ
jgi:ADP-dependent NAD(P)H-hydrate dehydratase / NAD(P)H-hydrate epimerase